jgi:hypothetical protein
MVALEAKQNQIFDVGRQALASRAYKKGNVMAEPYMDWTLNRRKNRISRHQRRGLQGFSISCFSSLSRLQIRTASTVSRASQL